MVESGRREARNCNSARFGQPGQPYFLPPVPQSKFISPSPLSLLPSIPSPSPFSTRLLVASHLPPDPPKLLPSSSLPLHPNSKLRLARLLLSTLPPSFPPCLPHILSVSHHASLRQDPLSVLIFTSGFPLTPSLLFLTPFLPPILPPILPPPLSPSVCFLPSPASSLVAPFQPPLIPPPHSLSTSLPP